MKKMELNHEHCEGRNNPVPLRNGKRSRDLLVGLEVLATRIAWARSKRNLFENGRKGTFKKRTDESMKETVWCVI